MTRFYVLCNTVVFDRPLFEAFLINYIHAHQMYDLRNLLGDGAVSVERHVQHHPLRLAKEIFGRDNVITYEK